MNNYSYFKSILKAIKYPILIVIGLLIAGFEVKYPSLFQMSVGGLVILIYDFLKHKLGVRILP